MIINEIKLKEFILNLKQPLWFKGRKLNSRRGIIIIVSDSKGHTGYGEISPLPGFNHENFDQAAKQIKECLKILTGCIFKEYLFINGQPTCHPFKIMELFPSVRFGLEMALMHLSFLKMVCSQKKPAFDRKWKNKRIPVNKLVPTNVIPAGEHIEEAIRKGYKSIKLKVGYLEPELDVERVLKLKSILPPAITLRLDANACWDTEKAIDFGLKVGTEKIEYIEDPIKNTDEILQFYRKTNIPVALDESFEEYYLKHGPDGFDNQFIKAIILKPGILGGFYKTYEIIRLAKEKNIKPVLSNTFQSGLALLMISLFIAQMDLFDHPAGLDTANFFINDLIPEAFPISNGNIHIARIVSLLKNIKLDYLKDL